MTKSEHIKLCNLLDKLMQCAPCHGGQCLGHQNCVFGENGCYGESCAIEDVLDGIQYVLTDKKNGGG